MAKRVFGDPGRSRRKTPACTGPISVRDPAAAQADVDEPQGGARRGRDRRGVHERRLARRHLALLPRRRTTAATRRYLVAIADAMRHEYEAIAQAGFILQIDCPDLAMGRHIQFADLEPRGVPEDGAAARRGPQPRHSRTSRPSSCACTCAGATTRVRTTTTCRWPTSSTSSSRRGPSGDLLRGRQPAPRARVEGVREASSCRTARCSFPGVIDSTTNFIEHPELVAAAHRPVRRARRPRERHRRHRLRLRHLGRPPPWIRHRLGQAGQPRGRGAARLAVVLVAAWPR